MTAEQKCYVLTKDRLSPAIAVYVWNCSEEAVRMSSDFDCDLTCPSPALSYETGHVLESAHLVSFKSPRQSISTRKEAFASRPFALQERRTWDSGTGESWGDSPTLSYTGHTPILTEL